jgi:hypothetical protein
MKSIILGLAGVVLLGVSWTAGAEEFPSPGWLRDSPTLKGQHPSDDPLGNSLALGEPVHASGNGQRENGTSSQAEEREHIKDNSFFVEEAYNQEPGVAQHIFNWVGLWRYGRVHSRNSFFVYTMELPIHSQTHQFSFALPFETFFEQVNGGLPEEQGGLGDIFLNYRYQLLTEETACVSVAPRFSLVLPTGDEGRGLGHGEAGFFFNLPVSKQLDPFAFHFNAGFIVIPDVSVALGNGLISPGRDLRGFNLGFSAIWLASYDLNFLLELVGLWGEDLDDLGFRDHTSEVILNPGLRYAVYTSDEVQWVLGISLPVGLSEDAPDYGVFGYMSVEHAFKKKEEQDMQNAK